VNNNQEKSLEKTMYASIPSLAENDEVLLYTITLFGKDQDKLQKNFENATYDYNMNKITAEEYYTIYITILKELCTVKDIKNNRYQSLDAPFMKKYSEKLWCSIADNLVKEDSMDKNVLEVKNDYDVIKKKKRIGCFPFFRKSSKKRHFKSKQSKSVNANSKPITINSKKQAMLEAKEKYLENEKNKVITEETEKIEKSEEKEQLRKSEKKEINDIDVSIVKEENNEKLPLTESKTQITIPDNTKEDNKNKGKKRWWKRIFSKKNKKDKKKKEKKK